MNLEFIRAIIQKKERVYEKNNRIQKYQFRLQ